MKAYPVPTMRLHMSSVTLANPRHSQDRSASDKRDTRTELSSLRTTSDRYALGICSSINRALVGEREEQYLTVRHRKNFRMLDTLQT